MALALQLFVGLHESRVQRHLHIAYDVQDMQLCTKLRREFGRGLQGVC